MALENLRISSHLQHEPEQEGGLQLDRVGSILKRHLLLIAGVTTLVASVSVAKALTETPTYTAEFELLTPSETLETEILSTINPDALSGQSDSVGVGSLDDTKLKILTSPRVLDPAVEQLQSIHSDITYQEVVNNLTMRPNDDGQTLTVKYQNEDPKKVVTVLDVISETFLRYSLEDRQNDIYRGIDFVDEQLPIVKDRVTQLEAELENLRQNSNLINPSLQGEQLSAQVARFTSEQLDLKVLLEQSEELYEDLNQELNQGGELAVTSALLESERYQALLDQLLAVDSQLADELTLYLDDSPEIAVIEERRANLKPLLEKEGMRVQEEVASYLRELRARDQALDESIEILEGRIQNLSTVTRQYNSIQRDLDIAATNLNQFLTKREALRIDAAQRQTPWEILTPRGAPNGSSSSAVQNLLLGGVLGVLLGAGLAMIVDRLSGKIYTVRDLKGSSQIPLLGAIPYNQLLVNGQSLMLPRHQLGEQDSVGYDIRREQFSRPFLEAFRRLATNIKLNSLDSHIKSLAVSSAVPDEGKSSVSFYLAHAIASLGHRTLLVDTDMRHPTLHKLCNVSNEKGLSSYLAGETLLSESLINHSIDENLFFMSSGPLSPDPAKVLNSRKMEKFYEQIYQTFDMVIFDTPPLLGFSDAFMVVKETQGLLLVSRLGHVKFSQLQSTLDELYISKVPTIGLVANDVKQSNDKPYAYHQYYETFAAEESKVSVEYANNIALNGGRKSSWKNPLSNILRK